MSVKYLLCLPSLHAGVLEEIRGHAGEESGAPYVAIVQDSRALLGNFTNHVFIVYYAQVSKPKTSSR